MTIRSKVIAVLVLVASLSSLAQQAPEEPQTSQNVVMFKCEVKNPQDLSQSTVLGNFRVNPKTAVKLDINLDRSQVIVSFQLSAGVYGLTPSKPRLYYTSFKPEHLISNGAPVVARNVNEEDTDTVKLSLSSQPIEGVISTYGAELNIVCGELRN